VTAALDRLGRDEGTTHYAVRLALFSALLALEAGRDEVTVGAYVDTRRHRETRAMFGYFSNLITLVLPFDPTAPLRGWIGKVQYILAEATAHSDLPYEQLCDELLEQGRVPPEINAIFSVRTPMPETAWLKSEQLPLRDGRLTMPWGFSFTVDQDEESNRCQVAFDANLHDRAGVRRFIDRYAGLAEAAAAAPDRPLGGLFRALR
jgi:non-ribosomal peptide synthetase component F